MRYRDLPSGLPPLPDDVMPDFERDDDEDDDGAYDGTELLKLAHFHIKVCAQHLEKAIATFDDIEPMRFGEDASDNPQGEKARRTRAANLDIVRRSLRAAMAPNI
jgi:hypothetical protein